MYAFQTIDKIPLTSSFTSINFISLKKIPCVTIEMFLTMTR